MLPNVAEIIDIIAIAIFSTRIGNRDKERREELFNEEWNCSISRIVETESLWPSKNRFVQSNHPNQPSNPKILLIRNRVERLYHRIRESLSRIALHNLKTLRRFKELLQAKQPDVSPSELPGRMRIFSFFLFFFLTNLNSSRWNRTFLLSIDLLETVYTR